MKKKTYERESEVLAAVVYGEYQLAARLIGTDYEIAALEEDGGGRTFLHWAVQEGQTNIVHWLLQHGANPEALDRHDITPFAAAAADGNLRFLKIMRHYGAKPNGVSPKYVPLHIAAAWNRWKCVRYLLLHGADINAQGQGGTALVYAVHHSLHGMTSYLIHNGARTDVKDEGGHLLWELEDENITPKTTRDLTMEGGLTLWEMAEERNDARMLRILNAASFRQS